MLLIQQGTPVTVAFGVAVLVLPLIGVWFLWQTTQFARSADRLARELEAEGGLPVDELVRDARRAASTGTRPTRSSPSAGPRRRRRRTTGAAGSGSPSPTTTPATPPRARKAMQRAIALHDGKPVAGRR